MSLYDTLDVIAQGLSAQRTRLDVTSSNMANAQTTRTQEGGPYKRRDVVMESQSQSASFTALLGTELHGVQVTEVVKDQRPPRQVYDPAHPDADKQGYVAMPNISAVEEMADMLSASHTMEAMMNLSHGQTEMSERTLNLGK